MRKFIGKKMENRKESEILKRISEETGKSTSTLYDWKKSEKNKKLYETLEQHIFNLDQEKELKNCNDVNYLKEEIFKALDKLPENQVKMYFHLIMAELAKNGH